MIRFIKEEKRVCFSTKRMRFSYYFFTVFFTVEFDVKVYLHQSIVNDSLFVGDF